MPEPEARTVQAQLDFMIEKIRQEKCVLLVGPEFNVLEENGLSCQQALLKQLDIPNNDNIYRYYPDDEFFLFDEAYKRTLICHQIKSFYQGIQPNTIHRMLAEIPFHIYLSVTPDSLLSKAFDEADFSAQSGYYKRNKDPQLIKTPSKKNPLIYNLFGSVESEESIILTHDDLYDYFKSIFAQRSMPEKLKIHLQEVKNFIFLGVPFDKWYMQLVLRELEIHNRQYEFTRFAANQSMTEELTTFCLDQFRINFISQNIEGFVRALHAQFSPEELRQPFSEGRDQLDKVRQLIRNAELEAAIDLMGDLVEDTELEDDVLHLAGRYRKYKKRVVKGVLSFENQQITENQLTEALMELIEEAKKLAL